MGRGSGSRTAVLLAVAVVMLVGAVAKPVNGAFAGDVPSAKSELPDASDLAKGLAQLEEEEKEAQEARETPEAIEEREASLTAFADLSAGKAETLLHSSFVEQLEALNSDPARFLSDAVLEQVLAGGMSAQVTSDGSPQLLEAGIPVVTRDEGEVEKVDLSLEGGPEGLEPENPLVSVVLPPVADEGIEIGEEGLTITQEGAAGDSTAQLFGDKNAFYYEAQNDTDLLASPVVGGVELSDQLRSSEAPQELHFALKLPAGASLHADSGGGAEVTRDGNTLARVPTPTAVDAQGAEVPVEMGVDGESLVVTVNHREGEYAYPILVDPTITEDWSSCNWYNNCNLQALSDGSWAPSESQSGWLYHSTSCIWTCWGSGRGLYLSAESGGHNPNQFAAWNYTPPGETSFVKSATLNPFSRNNYGSCSKLLYPQPHDYDGLWNPSSNAWAPLETNKANDAGTASPSGGGRILVVGLGTAESWAEDKCRRDIVVGGASVLITDPDVPTWTTAPSAPDQWTDTSVVPISGTASDPGLGTKYFNLYHTPSNGQAYNFIGNTERACSGLHASPCGSSWSSQIVNYSASALPNGVNWLDVYAYDALGIEHNSQGMPVHVNVDHTAPEIALSGELFSEKVNTYKGLVTATDGSSAAFATAQSGMKSVQMYLDGQLVRRYPETATPPACANPQQGINMGSCKFELPVELNRTITGEHLFKVVATDSLNHPTEKTVTLKLPKDEVAPSLAVTGPLKAAAGLWTNAAETSVTLESQDAATGVTEEAVYIDGTRVGAPVTQECFAGGCSFTHAFTINLAAYSTGSHTVKALAVDGAGNKTESSWTVKVDATSPSLDSANAPEVPAGWTPQLSSFTLNYSASDSGSGIKKVEVLRPSSSGTTLIGIPFNSSCTGSESSPCPASTSGSTTVSTTEMAQGIDNVTIKAYDAAGRVSNTRSITVYVDRSAPTIINADGPLVAGKSGSLIGLTSELNIAVRDFGSGIASLEPRLDGESLGAQSYEEIVESGGVQKCKGESCELTYATEVVVGSSFEPGLHHFELVIKDWAGQTATLAHDVTIDTHPPKVQLSGSLYEAAGQELEGSTGTLEASAEDGTGELSSGIAAIEFSVDGTPVEPRPALVVADLNNNRIEEFNEKGEFIRAFGSSGTGDGQMSHPAGVAVDPKGNVWVADKSNNRIQKFNEKGEFLLKAGSYGTGNGQFNAPEGIAVDPKGNVWVSDTYNGRVQEFNEKGEFVRVVSSKGSGTGQLGEPTGIDIGPGGNVWVADWQNNRVAVFNETGEFVRQFGTSGAGNGQFAHPDAIDVDSRGIVWVGDENNGRVEAFNEKGEYVTQFGSVGSGEGQFSFGYPMGIASDSKGNLWVSDTNNNRMQKWAIPNYRPTYASAFGSLGSGNGQFKHTGDVTLGNELCMAPACATQASKSFTYDEAKWGTGPHTVSVTVTDGSGNVDVAQVRVNEPLNVVAPSCPTAEAKTLTGGQAIGSSAAISGVEAVIPDALQPSEPYGGGPESPAVLDPEVTRNPEGVSLNELGIDVTESLMGGGIEDQAGGSFTVGQSSCMEPLQTTAAAVDPSVVEGSAVVYPNAAPDTDTIVRPTTSGTAIIEHLRGEAAPSEFSWAIDLESGEELVKLEDGGVAVVRPAGEDYEPESTPPVPPSGPNTLDDTAAQLAQSEYALAVANEQIQGEVTMVVAAPEVVTSGGEVVPGILRITGAQVITAELPPNAVAETEAMIILTSPPAEPESICASVTASNPQYAYRVCGEEEEDTEGEDSGDPLGITDLATTSDPEMNSIINIAVTKLENEAYESGGASASSGSSSSESRQQERFCKHGHQVECREFALDGLQAAIAEEHLFNIPSDSTQANAFRHIFWVALMHMDEEHSEDGLTWSLAHEEDQWKSHHPSIRNASRMDILNDVVGWRRVIGDNERATCESMLKKAALHSIFIGAKRDPYRWAKNNEFGYFNPVYRKLKDNIGPDATGLPVYATGTRCEEIGY